MNFLKEVEVSSIDMNSDARFAAHRKILERKTTILQVFKEIQMTMVDLKNQYCRCSNGLQIELGAGVYPMKENFPQIEATDVVKGPLIDRVLNAQAMDLTNESVQGLYAQNCLHHFPSPRTFFKECERVLKPGGAVIIIDPSHTILSKLIYPILFADESYDMTAPTWEVSDHGAMKGANQALSFLIFQRDRKQFQTEFPHLEIVHEDILDNSIRYLVSGGLNFKSLLPPFLFPFLKFIEKTLRPLRKIWGLHHVYVLRKK